MVAILYTHSVIPCIVVWLCLHTEGVDYESTIVPSTATLNRNSNTSCHSVIIYDDEDVEPTEMFSVSITTTGPSEFISLFNIITSQTVVEIVDSDSELCEITFGSHTQCKLLFALHIGLSVQFEYTAYTVSESSERVEVCLMFEGALTSSSFVELQISLTSVSATGK